MIHKFVNMVLFVSWPPSGQWNAHLNPIRLNEADISICEYAPITVLAVNFAPVAFTCAHTLAGSVRSVMPVGPAPIGDSIVLRASLRTLLEGLDKLEGLEGRKGLEDEGAGGENSATNAVQFGAAGRERPSHP